MSINLATRWMIASDSRDRLFTIAYLVLDDPEKQTALSELMPSAHLDGQLLSEILRFARPDELAEVLWSPVGLALSPCDFQSLFESALTQLSNDDNSIWRLYGGACDYLGLNEGAFVLSRDIVSRLLASMAPDSRVIGLKATKYDGTDKVKQLQVIIELLGADSETERCAAIYQLGSWFDTFTIESIPEGMSNSLRTALELISRTDKESELRHYADIRLDQIKRIHS